MFDVFSGRWKCPVGYFLTNGIDANIQSRLVQIALELGEEHGLNIRAITADGTNVNPATMVKLGVKFDKEVCGLLDTQFTFGKEVYFLLDACHMLKLARNALASLKVLFYFLYFSSN